MQGIKGIESTDLIVGNAAKIDYRRNEPHKIFFMPICCNLPKKGKDKWAFI